jgi:glycosyltransferase involved in cell wall biosynthesis
MHEKTIGIFIASLNTGGAEVLSVELANFLCKHYKVIVISAFLTDETDQNQNPSNFVIDKFSQNIKVIFLSKKVKSAYPHDFYVDQLRKVIKNEKIDLLIGTGTGTDAMAVDVMPQTFKWITITHGGYETFDERSHEYATAQRVFDSIDKIVYLTESQVQKYRFDQSKLIRIDNYSPKKVEKYPKFEKFTFCVVSRAHKDKGWEEVYLAGKQLIRDGHDIGLIFVGEGTEYQKLSKANNERNIAFTGHQQNPEKIIAKSHVGILVSKFEQQPLSIIDYINNNIPVITSRVGGCEDMITDTTGEKCGLVVDYGDIEELKNAMGRLINDKDFYKTSQDVAHKVKSKFDKDLYMSKMLETISGLL